MPNDSRYAPNIWVFVCAVQVSLPKRNFTIEYDTNIPRQVCFLTLARPYNLHFRAPRVRNCNVYTYARMSISGRSIIMPHSNNCTPG